MITLALWAIVLCAAMVCAMEMRGWRDHQRIRRHVDEATTAGAVAGRLLATVRSHVGHGQVTQADLDAIRREATGTASQLAREFRAANRAVPSSPPARPPSSPRPGGPEPQPGMDAAGPDTAASIPVQPVARQHYLLGGRL